MNSKQKLNQFLKKGYNKIAMHFSQLIDSPKRTGDGFTFNYD
jgi:hypothetical protein